MLGLRKRARSSIPTPAADSVNLTVDEDGLLVFKKEDGSIVAPEALVRELAEAVEDSATGADLDDVVASMTSAIAVKQDSATAATDTELEAEASARVAADALALPKAGGIMTGPLTLAADPTNNLHAATKQFVAAQLAALINGAPGTLDTLKEIADRLGADETVAEALAATVAGKLGAAANLSDLANAGTARANLGLGTAAVKAEGAFDAAGQAAAVKAELRPIIAPTHSLTDFGAVSGQDATAAFESAMAALTAGDVLLIPRGTFKLTASGGGVGIPDGVRIVGAGRKSSIIEPLYAGTSRVKLLAPIGFVEFADLGFRMNASINRSAEVQVIFARETATAMSIERCDFFGGFAMCVDTWQDKTTDYTMRDVLIDGENAGLASAGNRKCVMGVAHNGAGIVKLEGVEFRRLGCNAADKPFSSHCVYVAPTTTLLASKCRFREHIQGRLIQFYNGFVEAEPTAVGSDVIRDCEFGAYNAASEPFSMCETSQKKFTSYVDCDFASQATSSGVKVVVKGKARFPGCRFAGASTKPSSYLGDPEGEFAATTSYDANGAYFNATKFSESAGGAGGSDPSGLSTNFIVVSADPALASNGLTPSSNTNTMALVYLKEEKTFAFAVLAVIAKGEGLVAGQSEVGVYSFATGVLIARTADQATNWATTGEKEMALAAEPGQSLVGPAGYYYLALISTGTTRPTFTRLPAGNHTAASLNLGQVSGRPRGATGNTASNRLASTLGSPTPANSVPLIGLR
jgi:hypothetical protein